ncbi:hypothetical protein DZE41_005389 [Clostridium beijerinckii]|nr:hypothetical protein [Clostridium beijerinckii]
MPLVAEYNYVNDTGALLRLDKKLIQMRLKNMKMHFEN